ncbi:MAG TPA: hypothetical protein ENK55_08540 [Actinobacteria bacterium]|nr:hypothetical protein [Actinomycetota bacterium]
MSHPAALDRSERELLELLNGLGAAWVTFQLYPNPLDQAPFLRAVDLLAEHAGDLPPIGIGPGTFFVGGEEIVPEREGVEKFARQLFVHDVETLEVVGDPTAQGLAAFFEVISRPDDEVADAGGIAAALVGMPSSGLRIKQRGLLNLVAGDGTESEPIDPLAELVGELPEPARAALHGADPDEIAEAIVELEDGDGDPSAVYVDAFHELRERIDDARADPAASLRAGIRLPPEDPYRTLRSYIESFFHLPRWLQVEVLERVLAELSRPGHQMFLDQFSGNDLSELLPELSEPAQERLLEYAVQAASDRAGHPLDLLAGLSSAVEVEAARRSVADRVTDVLRAASRGVFVGDLEVLRSEMEAEIDPGRFELEVIRGLFECEGRQDRFQRVARVWTGRFTRHLRRNELPQAHRLLVGVLDDPPFGEDRLPVVRRALERMTTTDVLFRIADADETELADEILARLGSAAVEVLVAKLGEEEDAARRRHLVEVLGRVVRERPRDLEGHLGDHRWYLVRNLVAALGLSGTPRAVDSVRLVADHADHRVRTEVLRAYVRLDRDAAIPALVRALADPHERVRQNAIGLLEAVEAEDVDALLVNELARDRLPTDTAVAVVELLGRRGGRRAEGCLRELAGRRFVFGSRRRALRRAARAALEADS